MNTFKLRIIAADRPLYDGEAVSLTIPVHDGSMGILSGHSSVITAVSVGTLSYRTQAGASAVRVSVSEGLFRFEDNEATVLVDTAEDASEIDISRARQAEQRAREALLKEQGQKEHILAEADLRRALSRIKTKEH